MFAVGDEKQSIFSFQNAAPKEFDNMLRYFQSAHRQSGQEFADCRFEHSFRSGEAILEAVDKVFGLRRSRERHLRSGRLPAAQRVAGRAAKRGRDLGAN